MDFPLAVAPVRNQQDEVTSISVVFDGDIFNGSACCFESVKVADVQPYSISECSMILKAIATISLVILSLFVISPQDSSQEIEQVLTTQAQCWNEKDIDGFMETYWKSENLTFSGGGKTTRGWQATLDRYKKSYPKDKMGALTFDGLEVTLLADEAALVLGKWHLSIPQEEGDPQKKDGNFSLVLKKLDGKWKIIHDHSSTLEKEDE